MDYITLRPAHSHCIGTLGVMFKGDNENVREGISSVASILLLLLLWLNDSRGWKGKVLIFHMFTILPGVTVTLGPMPCR
jgi:multicomponent Na+:H+ antiporter subunit D